MSPVATPTHGKPKRVWHFMHALGRDALPAKLVVNGQNWRLSQFVKHDFFAATGFYENVATGDLAVAKLSRTVSFLGLPLKWLGRMICARELRFYARLADLPNVPAVIGRVDDTGFLHAFVPGRPLEKHQPVPDAFFDELLALINTLAARGIAVVDTNKPENILLGTDNHPHLIDFQISYDAARLRNCWPARVLLNYFVKTDRYHVLKHKSRLRPDLTTPEELVIATRRPWFIRLHRTLTRPYFIIRRRLFKHLRETGRLMPEGSK